MRKMRLKIQVLFVCPDILNQHCIHKGYAHKEYAHKEYEHKEYAHQSSS